MTLRFAVLRLLSALAMAAKRRKKPQVEATRPPGGPEVFLGNGVYVELVWLPWRPHGHPVGRVYKCSQCFACDEQYRAHCDIPKYNHLCASCFELRTMPWERDHYTRVELIN